MSFGLKQRQSQTQTQTQGLAMTPQLVQSIKLLQMNALELQEHLLQELEANPLLELADPADEYVRGTGKALEETEKPDTQINADLDTSSAALEAKLGTSLENEFDTDRSGGEVQQTRDAGNTSATGPNMSSGGGTTSLDGEYNIENFLAGEKSLRDHLGEQLALMRVGEIVRLVAADIIDSLDSDGYFRRDPAEVAASLGVEKVLVFQALEVVQGMEPAGIAARDLAESLKLQLVEKNRFDPAMESLLANLDLLARRDFKSLEKTCAVSPDDLFQMIEEIRTLDPRPARKFDHSPVQAIIADVIVQDLPDGSFSIELNPDALPRILVNQTYKSVVEKGNKEDQAYVAECLQNANWLTRSLEQRAQTILKVMTEIVRQQDAFFAYGIKHLKPMGLKQVAGKIKMHESTVSRVTSNKYVQTSRGIFELKFFFTAAIASTGKEDSHSAESVRHEIGSLIEAESEGNVLSDDALVNALQEKGIDIARRTVAKYREAMHIPSSVQRRREKKARRAAGKS